VDARFSFGIPRVTPFVRKLLVVLFSTFVVELLVQNWAQFPIFELLALRTDLFDISLLYRLGTYALVLPPAPTSVPALLFDLLFLWLLVAPFEERFGAKRTFQLSALSVVVAGLCALAASRVANTGDILAGSQPIALAALTAFAVSFRTQKISLFGAWLMKPMHLVWITVGYSTLIFLASRNVVVFASSLGAIATGIFFTKWMMRPRKKKSPSHMKVVYSAPATKPRSGKWLNRQMQN